MSDDALLLALVEEGCSQVLENRAVAQQVVDHDQQAVRDGNGGALGAAADLEPVVLHSEVALVATSCAPSGFDQRGP